MKFETMTHFSGVLRRERKKFSRRASFPESYVGGMYFPSPGRTVFRDEYKGSLSCIRICLEGTTCSAFDLIKETALQILRMSVIALRWAFESP